MKLIIINGACGVGKSTVAEALHNDMPLSVLIGVDELMRWINGYKLPENQERKRKTSNAMSNAVLDVCFKEGHDVIIEKMQFEQSVLDSQIDIANKYQVDVTEVILWAPKDVVMARADDRGWIEDSSLTPEKCEVFWDKIDELKDKRPSASVIDTSELSVENTIDAVRDLIAK